MASSPAQPSRPVYGPPAALPAGRATASATGGALAVVDPGTAAPRPEPADGPAPTVVVVGAAARVLDPADRRGWRLGGEAVHGALLLARLGLRVGAVLGVDAVTGGAPELDLLRDAGADLHLVELGAAPVLAPAGPVRRGGRSSGRRSVGPRRCEDAGSPLPVAALPPAWRAAPAWHLAPAADELAGGWAAIPPGAVVALAWQGALRTRPDGTPLRPGPPASRAVVRRANLVGLPAEELAGGEDLRDRLGQLRAGALCVLTLGARGGIAIAVRPSAPRMRRWSAPAFGRLASGSSAGPTPDPRGGPVAAAGRAPLPDDGIFLAALLAARVAPAVAGRNPHLPAALAFAAATVGARRGPVLADVPTLPDVAAVLRRRRGPAGPATEGFPGDAGPGARPDDRAARNDLAAGDDRAAGDDPRGKHPGRYDGDAPAGPGAGS